MSSKIHKGLKIFLKVLGLSAAAYSFYLLYNLLTVPWTYPILNAVSMVLLIAVTVFGILAALW